MTAWEATSFYQWICSVSVGDIINLLLVGSTIFIAVMAYRIQKTQVSLMKDQTMSSLVLADIARRDKESSDQQLRATIIRDVVEIATNTITRQNPLDMHEKVFFIYSSRSGDNALFTQEQIDCMSSILDIHTENVEQYIPADDGEEVEQPAHFSEDMKKALAKFLRSGEP